MNRQHRVSVQESQRRSDSPRGQPTLPKRAFGPEAGPREASEQLSGGTKEPRSGHELTRVRVHSAVPAPSQGRFAIGRPGDEFESEAERVASAILPKATPPPSLEPSNGRGQPLSPQTRDYFETHLGHDLSRVRIHKDEHADQLTRLFGAHALTLRSDIFFGANEYSPSTMDGQHLLAHELVHTVQQRYGAALQRLEIPTELQSSIDLTTLTETELHERYDLITATMSSFDHSTPETILLEEEAGRVGAELGRRALATGRTFTPEAVERMRKYFVQNVKRPKPRNCIDTMNDGLQLLYRDKKQPVGDSVDRTMRKLQSANRAGYSRVIEFEDTKGRVSRSGSLYPSKLHESVWDALLQMAGGDVGWSVFGMGPADMSHSVTLTLDNTDPSRPVVYWSDQWREKGGWKRYDRAGLDAAVEWITQFIWKDPDKDERHKPSTKVTLWRLRTSP